MRQILKFMVAAACGAAFGHASASEAGPHTHYRVSVLSSAGAAANSVDDLGLVAGSYTVAGGAVHASLWAFGTQIDLGTLGNGAALNSKVQWPVKNHLALVSGISLTDQLDPNNEGWSCSAFIRNPNFNVCQGFVWNPLSGRMRALRTLGGTNSFATGTNDLGETVGWAETAVRDPTCIKPQLLQFLPVVWGPGRNEIRALAPLAGDTSGAATALNNRGQVVGISGECGVAVGSVTAKHAVLWDNGVPVELKNPNHAGYWNTPMMINERGDVVGFAGAPNDPEGNFTPAFMWTRQTGFQFLPMLNGDIAATATSINSKRQVVGYSNDAVPKFHPWIWESGVTVNLNDLIEPNTELTGPIQIAFDINERGEIAGRTTTRQAVLLVPIHDRD